MTKRYCPRCRTVLEIQSYPTVLANCPRCNWTGGPDDWTGDGSTRSPYVSIDLETTGTDASHCQVLEFGAVIDNWSLPINQLPQFRRYIRPHDTIDGQPYIYGQPFALALNAEIIRKLDSNDPADDAWICSEESLGSQFAAWLQEHDIDPLRVTAAGKNFSGFDLQFLKQVHGFSKHVRFWRRAIDPAIFYWQPDSDTELPSTETCLKRAGLDDNVAHTAVEDCISIIQLIRHGVEKCRLSVSEKDTT